jgi:lipoprotein-anchoring transpeptidase ErfK/SrfK
MSASSLEHKTVRPGSLLGYSQYYSGRRQATPVVRAAKPRRLNRTSIIAALVVIIAAIIFAVPLLRKTATTPSSSTTGPAATHQSAPAVATTSSKQCAGNTLDQLIVVSLSQRHLWVCQNHNTVYDSPVITGIAAHADTVTPTGMYHIYGKQTNTVLTGSDSTGSWNDPISYWMPFLTNQYGTYGFHDATWRPDSAFGTIGSDSANASHGCVELPLQTAKWLYNWSHVGTALTINS